MRTSASGSSSRGGCCPSTLNGSAIAWPTSDIGSVETAEALVTPGACTQALDDILVEARQVLPIAILRRRQQHLRADEVVGLEARVDLQQLGEAPRHQARADEQHQRQRDFDDHKPARARDARRDCSSCLPESASVLAQIAARRVQRRDDAERERHARSKPPP